MNEISNNKLAKGLPPHHQADTEDIHTEDL